MKILAIVSERTNTGFPFAGGDSVEVKQSDIRRLGKITSWGSSVIQFVLELNDGRLVHVIACQQEKPVERWLRKLAKPVRCLPASRSEGWRIAWSEIVDDDPVIGTDHPDYGTQPWRGSGEP